MSIEQIKKDLKQWRMLRQRAHRLKTEIDGITDSISVVVVAKSESNAVSDRTANLVVRLEQLRQQYNAQLEQLLDLQGKYIVAMGNLNAVEHKIAWDYYICGKPLDKVSESVSYSYAHVQARLLPNILQKLALFLKEETKK